MATLESPPSTVSSIADLAHISRQLADDVARLPLHRDGFAVADYLSLDGNYFVELVNGCIQVLPMATAEHQDLTGDLWSRLKGWAREADPAGWARMAPFKMLVAEGLFREPDVCFMLGCHAARRFPTYWDGADLVIEVLSDGNRRHDEETKRQEYAAAGVPEYWMVDPEARSVRVLTLPDDASRRYVLHGEFTVGQVATGVVLPGFAVDVAELFAAVDPRA